MVKITKKQLHDLIEGMRESFTLEDLQYELFILQKLERAEEQLENGCKTLSLEEMRSLGNKWFES